MLERALVASARVVMWRRSILVLGLATLLLLCANAGLAAEGGSVFEAGIERYQELRLKNGLRVVMAVDRRVPRVAVRVRYAVGDTLDPPGERGLARVIGALLPKLSTRHVKAKDRALLLRAAGFEYDEPEVGVFFDATTLAVEVNSEALELVLWMEADRMGFGADGVHDDHDIVEKASSNWKDLLSTTGTPSMLRWAVFGPNHPYAVRTVPFGVSEAGSDRVADRDYLIEADGHHQRIRLVITETNLYMLLASARSSSTLLGADVKAFFRSLTFYPER